MLQPTADQLTAALLTFIQKEQGHLDFDAFAADWRRSGVYAVLDCVLSSQVRFKVVERALGDFAAGSGLPDSEDLTFGEFLEFMRAGEEVRPSSGRFAWVAENIFKYRGRLAGRLKVEVAYDVCEFFAARGYQTKADLLDLPRGVPFTCSHPGKPGELERLVMEEIVNLEGKPEVTKVRGMGLALGTYLLICLGHTDFVKPDTLLLRRMGQIGGADWKPRSSNVEDYRLIRQAISCAGEQLGYPAAAVEHALWQYESAGR